MKKTQRFLLEMCSGMFDCIWIGATIISLYVLYGALVNEVPWTHLLWSVGTGFIAKPLAVALDSGKRRLEYIIRLIERGYEPVAAEAAWRSADAE